MGAAGSPLALLLGAGRCSDLTRAASITVCLVLGVLGAGCGGDPQPSPATPIAAEARPIDDWESKDPTKSAIVIDPAIARLCVIPAAYFEFDSADLSATATEALEALAECFIHGKGRGRRLKIVGHADPRGELEYNLGLGQQRAASVALGLVQMGMDESRITTSSRGELEATGTDEEGWARDRRVEIFLG